MRGRPPLRLELLALGGPRALDASWTRPLLGPSRWWRSRSSFVAPRFPKHRRGRELDPPDEQLEHLFHRVLGEVPVLLRPAGDAALWAGFEQRRLKDPRAALRPASGWWIEFAAPVAGPIVLGHGAHFGLGCFEAREGCELTRRKSGDRTVMGFDKETRERAEMINDEL